MGRPVGSRSRGQAHIRHTSTSARCCCSCISEWPDGVAIYIWHRTAFASGDRTMPRRPAVSRMRARGQRDTIAESACLPAQAYMRQPALFLPPAWTAWVAMARGDRSILAWLTGKAARLAPCVRRRVCFRVAGLEADTRPCRRDRVKRSAGRDDALLWCGHRHPEHILWTAL